MNSKVQINRLRTGVPGLDEVLGGGLPEYSFNLLAGAPGSGKTTLAHQIMFKQATPERRALYFTVLGEPPLKMLRYQQQFDFFDASKLESAVRFVNLADETLTGDLDGVLARIVTETQAFSPSLVFVDSFRSVATVTRERGNSEHQLQLFVQELGMLMASWQATTFLLGEYTHDDGLNPVFTVADGLISLRQSVERNSMVRKMEVMKMRGQRTMPGLHTFRISGGGLTVIPPAAQESPDLPSQDGRLNTGVPGLDEMLGGGLPRGYSMLVAGPSGSGKSLLATAFLAEGCRQGETGVVAVFEQRPDHLRNAELKKLVAGGKVTLVDSRAPDLSIDELVMLLVTEIRRVKATRVVIDSLSGFELAIAPTFREDFRESLSRLVTALAHIGVTVLMTCELEDRYVDLRFSPYGTAFMTDAIIVQRYVEMHGRLRRVMAVVKVRGSNHSDELRLFDISEKGIALGDSVAKLNGLLTGKPTRYDDSG